MDFPIKLQTDNRQPVLLPLLTDTTAPLSYKIIVSFSVVIEFFLSLFKSNNTPNARLNHPSTSLLIGEMGLCFASIAATRAAPPASERAACNFQSVCRSNRQQRGCSRTGASFGKTLCRTPRTEGSRNPTEAPKERQDHTPTSDAGLPQQTGAARDGEQLCGEGPGSAGGRQGDHEPAACPGCQEGQWDPGVHQ